MPGQGGPQPPQARGRRARLSPATVEEVVSTDVVTAQRDTPVSTVAASMEKHDVGCVVVVEDDGETPVGVITDRKIALAIESTPDIGKRPAEELVSGDLLVGTMEMTVFEALDKLSEASVRRLPVVDEGGSLAGIVTLDDLIVVFGRGLGDVAEIIATQTMQ